MRYILIILAVVAIGCNKKTQKIPPSHSFGDIAIEQTQEKNIKPEKQEIIPVAQENKTVEINNNIYFNFDSYTIDPTDLKVLSVIATEAHTGGVETLYLSGYTCPIGTEIYNYGLGERRAMAVRDYLSQKIDIDFKVLSFGETKLVSDDPNFYHLNRYVHISTKP